MEILIANFLFIIVFAVPIGLSLCAVVSGKFPTTQGRYTNYVVWGDKNIDTAILRGARARFVAIAFIVLFTLFIIAIADQNLLIVNVFVSNLISILIGLVVGAILYKKFL